MNTKTNNTALIIPVMLSFFVMGMVDLVGFATNYAKDDFNLDDFVSSVLPMMVFLWFMVFSIPTGILMSRIGRKKTVLLALLTGGVALIFPLLYYNLYTIIIAFALLGIGNTMLQVSLNPLVASIVANDKLASTITFGQFLKAIASFLGPIIASLMVKQWGDWKLVFAVYAAVSVISYGWICFTPISEEVKSKDLTQPTTFVKTIVMLKDCYVLQLFLGILLIVGIDVCMNTNTPQLLKYRLDATTDVATLGSSLYFGARTLGAFLGALILIKMKPGVFLRLNMIIAIAAFLMLMFSTQQGAILTGVFMVGFTCANVFSIIFSVALQYKSENANEISSLMIMGVAGGAIVTPLVGLVAKSFGISISFGVLLFCVIYLLSLSFKFVKRR